MIKLVIQIGNEKTRQKGNEAIRQIRQKVKAKGQRAKRVFQGNKEHQNFPENEYFLPPDTHTYEIRPFALLPTNCENPSVNGHMFFKK